MKNGERDHSHCLNEAQRTKDLLSTRVKGREFNAGMIIFEGVAAPMWHGHNHREIDLNWILMI